MTAYELVKSRKAESIARIMRRRGLKVTIGRIKVEQDGIIDYHPSICLRYVDVKQRGPCFIDPRGGIIDSVFSKMPDGWTFEEQS